MKRSIIQDEKGRKSALYSDDTITLHSRIGELLARYGSLRSTARVLDIDHGYLSRLYHGQKREPRATVLRKLGVFRVVKYRRTGS